MLMSGLLLPFHLDTPRRQYDVEYIDYLAKIVAELPKYGLSCIIDAHQDVFSRLTGGSGAPGWVLDVLGLSVRNLHETHSAHLHPLALLATDPPPAVWPTGYQKLAAATCNTVFWAGDRFAWKRKAPDGSGRGLSTFLQEAMAEAFGQLADKLEGYEAVLGFEVRRLELGSLPLSHPRIQSEGLRADASASLVYSP